MKFSKNLLSSAVAVSILAAAATAPVAQAEVSGSVGVANMYLWRGADLGNGVPAVSGDLSYSTGGFYTGIWGSSGDATFGTEFDLYIGYGMSFADDFLSVDASLWSYNYPNSAGSSAMYDDVSDFVLSLGVGPVAFTAYVPVGQSNSVNTDYMYYTLGGSVGDFSLTVGMHADNAATDGAVACPADTDADDTCSPVHVNVDYAYNDNLTFTLSQFIADEGPDDELKFVVSYSLPIGE